MKIFVDTGAFLAILDRDQDIHPQAKSALHSLQQQHAIFYTSSFVISETYTRIIYDLHIKIAERFNQMIEVGEEIGLLYVFWIDPSLDREIYPVYKKFSDHRLSYADAASYLLVKKFRLDGIFTFDEGFKKVGLPVKP